MSNTVNNVIEDIWESSEPLVLTESADEVIDGSHIIGRVVGECFFPGGVSRNKRRYSESLWKKTLDKLAKSETFSRRDMLGTVGHGQPIDEAAILDGKITHIVNKLWVSEDNKGMGEFLILGTTSGRNLYTLLKAGKKISFSTRASGSYKGKDSSGNDLMNEDTYELQTVDFVIDPGFLKALPSIIESNQIDKSTTDLQTESGNTVSETENQTKTSSQSANISIKENTMSDATKEFVDHLKNENATVKADRDKLLTQASDLNATIDQLNAKIADLQTGSAAAGEIAKELESTQSALATAQAELKSANDKLAAYSELGEPEELQEALDKSASQVARLLAIESKLGSAEDIENALDSSESFISKSKTETNALSAKLKVYEELGTPEEISALINGYKEFNEQYGTTSDIATFMNKVKEFQDEYGSFDSISEALDRTCEFIKENGPLSQVSEALSSSIKALEEMQDKERQELIDSLADELNVPKETVEKLLSSGLSEQDIRDTFKEVTESRKNKTETKTETSESNTNTNTVSGASYLMGAPRFKKTTADVNESNTHETKSASLAARLMGNGK